MELQQLYSKVRKAIDTYNMIEEGDILALGVSGGKDSLALLYALSGLSKFYSKKFKVIAITVDLGFEGFDLDAIKELCLKLDVDYYVVKTKISEMMTKEGCSLCARLRKGALHDEALRLGCNKIVYAHNMDDVVETMMLSLIYEGRFSTFYPVTDYEDKGLKLIRPLIFATSSEIIGFKNKYELPIVVNPCPYDKTSERTYVRDLLNDINRHAHDVKKRMMTAICDGTIKEWSLNQDNYKG